MPAKGRGSSQRSAAWRGAVATQNWLRRSGATRGRGRKPRAEGRGPGNIGVTGPRVRNTEVIERGIPGFRTLSYRTKLNYYDIATISTGAGSAGTRVYSCNGLYDPDITGTGHQPMPFDQLMLSYEHYVCTKAIITVSFKNTSTSLSMGVSISANASSTPTTSVQALVENGVLVRDRLTQFPYTGCASNLTFKVNVAAFGHVDDLMDNPSYEGSISANPTEQSYFHISVWNPDSVSSIDCLTEIWIQYFAVFREPRKNSVSLNRALQGLIVDDERKTIEEKKEPVRAGPQTFAIREQPELAHRGGGSTHQQETGFVHVQPPGGRWVQQGGNELCVHTRELSVAERQFHVLMGAQCGRTVDQMEAVANLQQVDEMALAEIEAYYDQLNESHSLTGAG